ncbi:MAG: DNA gyrase subunit A [Dehalococcoidia bacterium]
MTTEGMSGTTIRPIKIEEEMRASYLDYAMSVIVARALPSVQDGLKPVQRRILYAMSELGLRATSRHKKSAGIVGEVLKNFHPHGDSAVYDAMVRMAQDFSLRYPLVDGQGNFGSVDNDPPAAMRYTEVRLSAFAEEMLADIDKNTVDFVPNYDDSTQEPVVLPSRVPNLLVNGASGIAVGMATSLPPHNLSEICDAIVKLIEAPDTTTDELAEIVVGPDFPTGGIIYRMRSEHEYDAEGKRMDVLRDAIKQTYGDGKGRIIVQARTMIEESARGGRMQIIVTELPYQVNKAALIERIAGLVRDKKMDGISDLRDESDRHGMRIVIELSRTGQARQVLNQLYKHTPMQSTFPVNMLALVDGQPRVINLKTAIEQYIGFRRIIIRRRTEFDLEKAKDRQHILEGLIKALDKLDEVIKTIRAASSADDAKDKLMERPFGLSDRQAQAVLDMQLRRLARLERTKIEDEYKEITKLIGELEDLLAHPKKIDAVITSDALELKEKYGDERRTQIVAKEAEQFTDEDLVAHQEVVITISNRGYIKRLPLETYRPQRRGGRGITGMITREADAVHRLIVGDTHDSLLFFTDRGRVFQMRAFDVPDASRQAKGIPLINLIDIDQQELVTAVVMARDFNKDCMVLATTMGEIKKTSLSEFASVRRSGLIAMNLEKSDVLISAKLAHETDDVLMVTSEGQSNRFPVKELRSASRASGGVRGIRLGKGASLVSADIASQGDQLFVLSELGYGKRTPIEDFPKHHRGGGGVICFKTRDTTGPVVAARMVKDTQELIVISRSGIVLRTRMDGISIQGRPTQGVSVITIAPGDGVASVATIEMAPDGGPATAEGPEPPSGPSDTERRSENGHQPPLPGGPGRNGESADEDSEPAEEPDEKPSASTKGAPATSKAPQAIRPAPKARPPAKPAAKAKAPDRPAARARQAAKPARPASKKVDADAANVRETTQPHADDSEALSHTDSALKKAQDVLDRVVQLPLDPLAKRDLPRSGDS